ncbi:hypothetical protein NPIL_643311, partial [Nephila pilipes]
MRLSREFESQGEECLCESDFPRMFYEFCTKFTSGDFTGHYISSMASLSRKSVATFARCERA